MTFNTPFTDDDLKRLKEFFQYKGVDLAPRLPFDGSPFEKTKALLARLEAAEAVINECSMDYKGDSIEKLSEYQAWRKAAGK